MTYFYDDAISRLEQVREETLEEMLKSDTYSDAWNDLWQIERDLGSVLMRLKIAESRIPSPIPEREEPQIVELPPQSPKQYLCAHDYNLQREYCPMGCKL